MIQVRSARREDADTIAAFQQAMARETEARDLDEATLRSGVARVFDQPDVGFYLVAEHDDAVIASLMVTPEWSDWRDAWFWWIQSVYVAPAHRRRGAYRALHDAVRERAAAAGDVHGIRLYVEKDNETARETYAALGMSASIYRLYEETIR